MENNVLLGDWELPPFDKIGTGDYEPAVMAALAEAERTVEAIAVNPDEPTFGNTVEALEAADRRLSRISAVMLNLNECCTSDALQTVVERLEPLLTRFSTRVMTDRRLYARVTQVAARASGTLDGERQALLDNTLKSFRRHGVALEGEAARRYKQNEEELSRLKLQFGRNALADRGAWTLHLTDEADLDGLPDGVRATAREEAAAKGLEGWLFSLEAPSYLPFMTYSSRRNLRERMYRAYNSIGNRGGATDNNAVIARIVELRAGQAALLGYDTYCDYILEDRMVQSLANLRSFMDSLREAVLPAARRDVEALAAEAAGGEVMPWDVSFLSERLRRRLFDFDSEALRPYFPLDAVREGIFGLYGRLYGLRFAEDPSVPVYHPDVRVYRVWDGSREMGLLYLDMHPRPSKRSGAWMTEFRGQHREWDAATGRWRDVRPQIQVVCNFSKPTATEPALLRFSEVETFMHEMGHAMHGLLSDVRYESMGGTNVKRDFVEMPSQLMENWCYEPEFLATFARHYQSGAPLPADYVDRIRAAQNHMAGWLCLRQLNLGMTDIAFHTSDWSDKSGASDFKAEAVEAAAMTDLLPRVGGCCTATGFGHIFGGGYASGYYGYKWAEVLDADIFSRFKADGIFCSATARRFRETILSRGGTAHPAALFRDFMGRDPDNNALLKRMNLL